MDALPIRYDAQRHAELAPCCFTDGDPEVVRVTSDILDMIRQTLDDVDNPDVPTSRLVRQAIRIAKLRGDYDNLLWLQHEVNALEDHGAKTRLTSDLSPHFQQDLLRIRWKRLTEA